MDTSHYLDVLACPSCQGAISPSLECKGCGRSFTTCGSVLQMLPEAPQSGGYWGTQLVSMVEFGQQGTPTYHHDRFSTLRGRWKNLRERAIVDGFLARLPRGSWVVDVPCGMGRFEDLALRRGLRACGIDLNLDHVTYAAGQIASSKVLWIQGDLAALPLRSDTMAAALCIRVSYYFDDDTLAQILAGVGRVAFEVLLSYRDVGSVVGQWKSIRGRTSKSPWKNRTFRQISNIAEQAGLRVAHGIRRRIRLHDMQFVHLLKEHGCRHAPTK